MTFLTSMSDSFAPPVAWLRERFSVQGPRAYGDTHDVALSLLGGAPPCRCPRAA